MTSVFFYVHPSSQAFGVFAFACLLFFFTFLIQIIYKRDPYLNADSMAQLKHEIKEIRENEAALKLRLEESHNKIESIKAAMQIRTL